jgi:hypothetical protein
MKVLAYAHVQNPTLDIEKIRKKEAEVLEQRKKFPDRYPKQLSGAYTTEAGSLKRIYEGTKEQLANLLIFWWPEMLYRYEALFEDPDIVGAAKRIGKTI